MSIFVADKYHYTTFNVQIQVLEEPGFKPVNVALNRTISGYKPFKTFSKQEYLDFYQIEEPSFALPSLQEISRFGTVKIDFSLPIKTQNITNFLSVKLQSGDAIEWTVID